MERKQSKSRTLHVTHHAPPVISRLGSSSNSMYTLRFPLATLFTAFTSLRCSSAFRHLLICNEFGTV
jgi:hypothetical protein